MLATLPPLCWRNLFGHLLGCGQAQRSVAALQVKRLSCVHVAGTKGKGSTCAFAESILRRGYGLRTGLFTSPNLVHVRYLRRCDLATAFVA